MEDTLCGTERKLLQGACSLRFLYVEFQVSGLIDNRHRRAENFSNLGKWAMSGTRMSGRRWDEMSVSKWEDVEVRVED